MLAHAVEGELSDVAVVGDVREHSLLAEPIRSPAKGLDVRVAQTVDEGGAGGLRVRLRHARVHDRIFAVLVAVVLVDLPGVVRRVADDDEDRRPSLGLDALSVALGDAGDGGLLPSASSNVSTRQMPSNGMYSPTAS